MTEYKRESFYPNGQKRCKETHLNGKLHGNQESWYYDGKKCYEKNYLNGKQHGRWEGWYENGQKRYEWNYLNGYQHGKQDCWYANGKRRWEWNYLNGKQHGRQEIWNENGVLVSLGVYCVGYPYQACLKLVHLLRRAKWLRLARLVRSRPFVEWWYHPENTGGKISKQRMMSMYESIGRSV